MKIVVLTGSPHRNGTSSYLANKFIEGATEAGHEVTRFDAAFEDVVFEQEHLEEDLHGALVEEESCSIAIAQNCSSLPDGQPEFCQI